MTDIPNSNSIIHYMHCGRCLKSKPSDLSPRDFASIEVGWTKLGLQVWCKRHEVNICHIDFEGNVHPANTTALRAKAVN